MLYLWYGGAVLFLLEDTAHFIREKLELNGGVKRCFGENIEIRPKWGVTRVSGPSRAAGTPEDLKLSRN